MMTFKEALQQALKSFLMTTGNSFEGYKIPAEKGKYNVVLSSDDEVFGGFQRAGKDITYTADDGFLCYLPSRTAIVFKKK